MVELTEAAVAKVSELLEVQPDGTALRVAVKSGGCSGLSYDMHFDLRADLRDVVLDFSGVRVLLDPESAVYLAGAVLDWREGLMGSGFSWSNPGASRTCGCGSSFS